MIQVKNIMFRYDSRTKRTYIWIGGIVIGTLQKFKGNDKPFTVSYRTMDGTGFPHVNHYFETREQAIDHIVVKLSGNESRRVW